MRNGHYIAAFYTLYNTFQTLSIYICIYICYFMYVCTHAVAVYRIYAYLVIELRRIQTCQLGPKLLPFPGACQQDYTDRIGGGGWGCGSLQVAPARKEHLKLEDLGFRAWSLRV